MESYNVYYFVPGFFHMVYHESALLRSQLLDRLWQNPEIMTNLPFILAHLLLELLF